LYIGRYLKGQISADIIR